MLRLDPLHRIIDRPVGYVVDSERIIGEWDGERWQDVPRKAALYVNRRRDIERRIDTGELIARRFVRHTGRRGATAAWLWESPSGNPHRIYNLDGSFTPFSTDERIRGILEIVNMVREAKASIGSPSGMIASLARSTRANGYSERKGPVPADRFWRGSRIQHVGGAAVKYPRCILHDQASAFPSALAGLELPRRWKEYPGGLDIPDEPSGFAEAYIHVPPLHLGPLHQFREGSKAYYPTNDDIRGFFTLAELRAARDAGCEVLLHRFWVGSYYQQPWAEWGQALNELRSKAETNAGRRLLKRGANQYVGGFAAHGHIEYERLGEVWTLGKGERLKPKSLTIHSLVTASVRTKLFSEGMSPFAAAFVSCHTDGVILLADMSIGPELSYPGWIPKREMDEVLLLDAQRYAWRDRQGEYHYVYAGWPDEWHPDYHFWRSWERRRKWKKQKSGIGGADRAR